MNYVVDFAGVAGAIGFSVALALWLEWVTLRGLMKLMPAKAAEADVAQIAAEPSSVKHELAKAA